MVGFVTPDFHPPCPQTSNGQVKKMNTASMEREAELASLRKKLESMVKLNKTLSQERAQLLERCKTQVHRLAPYL